MIIEATKSLIEGNDLTLIDTREVFDEILSGLSDEIQTSAFLTALKTKTITNEELEGAILSSQEALIPLSVSFNSQNSIQNLYLEKKDNIIDVSFVQDLICSANDLAISKYSFSEKHFKTAILLGIDLNKEKDLTTLEFENLNFGYLYLSQNSQYFKYLNKISRSGLFNEILEPIYTFLNPLKSKNIFLGVKNKELVQKYANMALSLKYDNSIFVSSNNNFPFLSLEGESFIAEAWKNKIFTYVANAELLGFKEASNDTLICSSQEENASYILEILEGKIKDNKYDFIILNSALSLYISKKADSIMDGINLAKKTIDAGLAYEKLNQIRKFYQ